MTKDIIKIENLQKIYKHKNSKIIILENLFLNIKEKDIISIVGPSGVGKSTLLNILGLLDDFNHGKYFFEQIDVQSLNEKNKNLYRNKSIGFVHQFFHLIPELTILENVALPNLIKNNNQTESYIYAKHLLEKFNLQDRLNFKPINLSGGEQQRVAIARSLINKPKIIIADEMNGNLDEESADNIFEFFINEIKRNNQTLIYATHNKKYSAKANIELKLTNKILNKL